MQLAKGFFALNVIQLRLIANLNHMLSLLLDTWIKTYVNWLQSKIIFLNPTLKPKVSQKVKTIRGLNDQMWSDLPLSHKTDTVLVSLSCLCVFIEPSLDVIVTGWISFGANNLRSASPVAADHSSSQFREEIKKLTHIIRMPNVQSLPCLVDLSFSRTPWMML